MAAAGRDYMLPTAGCLRRLPEVRSHAPAQSALHAHHVARCVFASVAAALVGPALPCSRAAPAPPAPPGLHCARPFHGPGVQTPWKIMRVAKSLFAVLVWNCSARSAPSLSLCPCAPLVRTQTQYTPRYRYFVLYPAGRGWLHARVVGHKRVITAPHPTCYIPPATANQTHPTHGRRRCRAFMQPADVTAICHARTRHSPDRFPHTHLHAPCFTMQECDAAAAQWRC